MLRPITLAQTETSADTTTPPLATLEAPFLVSLQRAEAKANSILDALLSGKRLIVTLNLGLRGREISTAEDVEALVNEVRERLLAKVGTGARVRLV